MNKNPDRDKFVKILPDLNFWKYVMKSTERCIRKGVYEKNVIYFIMSMTLFIFRNVFGELIKSVGKNMDRCYKRNSGSSMLKLEEI